MTALEDLKQNFLKDGTNEIHWGKTISSIIAFVVFIAFVIYKTKDIESKAKERLDNLRYTIGTTGNKHHNIKSSQPTVEFHYNVLGSEYKDIESIDAEYEETVVSNGGRYFVEFSSKNPDNSKLLLGEPVPDSIRFAPDSGWIILFRNK